MESATREGRASVDYSPDELAQELAASMGASYLCHPEVFGGIWFAYHLARRYTDSSEDLVMTATSASRGKQGGSARGG